MSATALRRAFLRVNENHGCAGADDVSLAGFESGLDGQVDLLRRMVEDGSYFAWPLRKIEVEKAPGSAERRTLLVPAVRDRVLQTAAAAYMEPFLEAEFDECSFAYRRGRSVRMAVERVYQLYQQGYCWLLDADIQSFFGTVDREIAIGRLATLVPDETVVRLARLWLDSAVWDGLHLTRPTLGLPEGAVISPMLANLCLDVLDDRLLAEGIKMVRYADDFVVLTKGRKAAEQAQALTEEVLAGLRLRLNQGKTRIVRFSEGFKFLGIIFLKDLLLQPWKPGRKRLKVLSVAPPLPESFFPQSERRPLRRYRVV
ncbi:MAG: RNA-directed DNA polymerase [Acidobacteriia bacterium]|nr:RNA-directed DNA polymerase [Terriglobia bacterium]